MALIVKVKVVIHVELALLAYHDEFGHIAFISSKVIVQTRFCEGFSKKTVKKRNVLEGQSQGHPY